MPNRTTRPPIDMDRSVQSAVLAHLLAVHPVQTTQEEIVHDLSDASNDFAARDNIENAISAVVRAGLAHRHGSFILPTRALVYADALDY